MKRIRVVGMLSGVLLVSAAGVQGGQIPSHIYTALGSIRSMSGATQAMVMSNQTAYLSGCVGPDVCGVVMPGLDSLSAFKSAGGEPHYSPLKNELAVNMLDSATTDAARAYALGWISHYLNDVKIHALVNEYGGYYKDDEHHHKVLEMLECKHVYTKHAGVVTKEINNAIPADYGTGFAGFIFDAYHATYPSNSTYTSGDEWFFENRPYFGERYHEAAGWCRDAGAKFYGSHADNQGDHGWALASWKFPDMPSTDQYKLLNPALEIKELTPQPDRLQVKVKVNDSKLYGRFLVEWEQAARAAIASAGRVFPLACQYLEEKDPARKASLRTSLVSAVPNVNLDQPLDSFDSAKAVPGNVHIEKLTFKLSLYPAGGGAVREFRGESPAITYDKTNFAKSKSGEVEFDILVPAGVAPYNFKLQVGLSGTEASFGNPFFKHVDWVQEVGEVERSICFLVDCSGSMGGSKIKEAIAAVKQAVTDTADGKTEWAIAGFSSCGARVKCRFTMDPAKVQAAADRLGSGGDTPLSFGTAAATHYLVSCGSGKTGRLIVLADGDDNCPGGPGATHRGHMKADEAEAAFRPMFQRQVDVTMPGAAAPVAGGGVR